MGKRLPVFRNKRNRAFVLNFIISNSIGLQFRAGRYKFQQSSKPFTVISHFMRIYILSIAIVTASLSSVKGQINTVVKSDNAAVSRLLVLVDSFKTDMKYLILDPRMIESISVHKDSNALAKFGEMGRHGVVIIKPTANATLLQIGKILEKYKIANLDRKLRICIDKTLVREPELILIEESEILDVKITTERHWTSIEDANSKERFINIITRTDNKNGL